MSTAPDLSMFYRHGGRIAAAERLFPAAPRPWLDLSTGINPRPYPAPRPGRTALARLPDPEAVTGLETRAAAAFGCAADRVAATPGSEAALRLLPRLLGARTVHIAGRAYGGHAEAWSAAGAVIHPDPQAAEALVVVNPNNPDGRVTPYAELEANAAARWVVVDEAFVDASPGLSIASQAGGRLVALRSFGKFYGVAGVRLGFVVAAPDLATKVRRAFGDWPVSAEALAAGQAAYADPRWRERTMRRLSLDRVRLDALLAAAGLEVQGGTDLFGLAHTPHAERVFLNLARAGVLCRPFDGGRLRFGLPGRTSEWRRLETALEHLETA